VHERDGRLGHEDAVDTTDQRILRSSGVPPVPVPEFDDFASTCCGQSHLQLRTDPASFSMTQQVGQIGPVTISEFATGSDMWIEGGAECGAYKVLTLRSGRTEGVAMGLPDTAGPGTAAVYGPLGLGAARWTAGTRMVCFRIDPGTIYDALSDVLGRSVTSRLHISPVMPITAAPTQSWLRMLIFFKDQMFRADGILSQPLVALPFVDSLLRGFLFATEHSHRDLLECTGPRIAPRAIRMAVEMIEGEADSPLTVSSIAARSHVSVRSLQEGFRRHLGTSPMSYLREVRLGRARRALLDSDPSSATVTAVAHRWGFNNLGRFTAAYHARYLESPVETLRRGA
jgi:AraC-like DNA-binding protein